MCALRRTCTAKMNGPSVQVAKYFIGFINNMNGKVAMCEMSCIEEPAKLRRKNALCIYQQGKRRTWNIVLNVGMGICQYVRNFHSRCNQDPPTTNYSSEEKERVAPAIFFIHSLLRATLLYLEENPILRARNNYVVWEAHYPGIWAKVWRAGKAVLKAVKWNVAQIKSTECKVCMSLPDRTRKILKVKVHSVTLVKFLSYGA